jgi:hypothetical protein
MTSLSREDTKAGRLQRACLAKHAEHKTRGELPTNATFVFYELEQDGDIPKKYVNAAGETRARTPRQDVSDALMVLRQIGAIPWDDITDETREIVEWPFAATVYEYAIRAAKYARIDCWAGEPAPLVICESRATKGVLERVTSEYLVPITATGGQSGGFLVKDVVPRLLNDTGAYNGREILYIGDHEVGGPGDQIEANTNRYLVRHTDQAAVRWLRIALTQRQVDANKRLLGLVIDKVDNRCKPARPYKAVECEAVGQAELERILRAAIEVRLPEPLAAVRLREEAQRRDLLNRLASGSC